MILELKFWLNLREYFDVLCSSTQEIVKVEVELVVSRKAIYEAWVYKWIVNHFLLPCLVIFSDFIFFPALPLKLIDLPGLD